FHPLLTRQFRYTFDAQHDEFLRLYGRPPSHLDGHHHMHLATNMLVQRIAPAGTAVRRSFSFRPGERGFLNRWYRRLVDVSLQRRHRLTDYFFSLSQHMSIDRLDRVIVLSTEFSVELMTHPQSQAEYDFLMGED